MAKLPQTRIGISGWRYAPWRGIFYPKDLPQKRELEHASRMLNSIEINGSFYSLQRPSSYAAWYAQTPENFVFSAKGPRFISHMRRLKNFHQPLANFFASGILGLKEKLGPILWQLPPNLSFDQEVIDAFLSGLPADTQAAADLAAQHDDFLKKDRVMAATDAKRPLRYAMEVRHQSFADPAYIKALRKHGVAHVIADTAGKWPLGEDITANFVYLRLHGDQEIYASGYTPEALRRWADRLKAWQAGKEPPDARRWSDAPARPARQRDVYVYFDNDVKVKAPYDAMSLADLISPAARGVGRDESAPTIRLTKKAQAQRVRSHWPGVKKPAKQ